MDPSVDEVLNSIFSNHSAATPSKTTDSSYEDLVSWLNLDHPVGPGPVTGPVGPVSGTSVSVDTPTAISPESRLSSGSSVGSSGSSRSKVGETEPDSEYANGPVFRSKEELRLVLRQKIDEAMVPIMNENPYKLYNSSLHSHGQRDVLSELLLDAVKDVKGSVREPEGKSKKRRRKADREKSPDGEKKRSHEKEEKNEKKVRGCGD